MVGTTMFSSDKECLNKDTQGDSGHSGKYSDAHDADLRVQLMCIVRALCQWTDGRNMRIQPCRSRVNFRTTDNSGTKEKDFSARGNSKWGKKFLKLRKKGTVCKNE